jgi:hypothetical protein
VQEEWRIEWLRAPEPVCREVVGIPCACWGFTYGEKDPYDVVR